TAARSLVSPSENAAKGANSDAHKIGSLLAPDNATSKNNVLTSLMPDRSFIATTSSGFDLGRNPCNRLSSLPFKPSIAIPIRATTSRLPGDECAGRNVTDAGHRLRRHQHFGSGWKFSVRGRLVCSYHVWEK